MVVIVVVAAVVLVVVSGGCQRFWNNLVNALATECAASWATSVTWFAAAFVTRAIISNLLVATSSAIRDPTIFHTKVSR